MYNNKVKQFIKDEYFDNCENEDNQLLIKFNEKYKLFIELNRHSIEHPIDYDAIGFNGKKVNIELKKRELSTNTFDTTFIEPLKYNYLMREWQENKIEPLFINFFNDGILIWNLKTMDYNKLKKQTVKLYDKGHKSFYVEERILLPNYKSYFYKY